MGMQHTRAEELEYEAWIEAYEDRQRWPRRIHQRARPPAPSAETHNSPRIAAARIESAEFRKRNRRTKTLVDDQWRRAR